MNALLYLNIRLLRNRMIASAKNPKQVAPFLFIGLILVAPLLLLYSLGLPRMAPPFSSQDVKPILFTFLTFATWIIVIYSITTNTLVFSLSEIDFLFPSPLKRKIILLNRILTDYFTNALLSLGICTFILFTFSVVFEFSFWIRLFFLWTAATLIVIFASNIGWLVILITSHLSELRQSRSRWALTAVCAAFLCFLSFRIYELFAQGISLTDAFERTLDSAIIRTAMFPVALAADTAVAWTFTVDILLKIFGLLILCVTTLGGILLAETHFYETAEVVSKKRWKERRKALTKEIMVSESFARRMFKIRPFGSGSTVLIWKNLVGALRDIRNLGSTLALAVFYIVFMSMGLEYGVGMAFPLALIAVSNTRWDLREDLRRIEIIKLIPDSNSRIVLSEIAVPTLISTLISWGFIIASFLFHYRSESDIILFGFCFIFLPLFCMVTALLFNLIALYYPPQTSNQIFTALVGVLLVGIVFAPMVVLVFFSVGRVYSLVVSLLAYSVVASLLLKFLERKYQYFDVTSNS